MIDNPWELCPYSRHGDFFQFAINEEAYPDFVPLLQSKVECNLYRRDGRYADYEVAMPIEQLVHLALENDVLIAAYDSDLRKSYGFHSNLFWEYLPDGGIQVTTCIYDYSWSAERLPWIREDNALVVRSGLRPDLYKFGYYPAIANERYHCETLLDGCFRVEVWRQGERYFSLEPDLPAIPESIAVDVPFTLPFPLPYEYDLENNCLTVRICLTDGRNHYFHKPDDLPFANAIEIAKQRNRIAEHYRDFTIRFCPSKKLGMQYAITKGSNKIITKHKSIAAAKRAIDRLLGPAPGEYDAVLGGKSDGPRPYDAVLGGKKDD